jgi:mitochondrial-processing peptidase subunit alpha
MYKVECLRGDVPDALSLLSDALLCPLLTNAELDNARQVIAFQRSEAAAQPQVLVSEQLYAAAYGKDTPLGRPEKCPENAVGTMTAETMRKYAASLFSAPRMVLSAVGVEHDVAVSLAEKYLSAVPASTSSGSKGGPPRPRVPYVGGDERTAPDWDSLPPTVAAATAKTEFSHIMLAFPTVGWSHDDVVPVCVIDTLLGGGSSFSAGGPGKGMYSRLYREVLNAYGWVDAANAFSTQLFDSGIIGIYAAADPAQVGSLARILAKQLARLAEQPVQHAELARARNQLASSVLMNLETRALLSEDIGRQILSHGKRMDPSELVRRIQSVQTDDILRVMRKSLAAPPSFSMVGHAGADMVSYEALRDFFSATTSRLSTMNPIFPRKL